LGAARLSRSYLPARKGNLPDLTRKSTIDLRHPILRADHDDTPIPPQIMAEIESMTPERLEAVAPAAARS
jgi:hypothetical protein